MTAPILKLRAVRAKDLEGFPLISVGDGWYLETVGMSASSVGDALAALGDDDAVIHLLAKAPQLAAEVARLTAERDEALRGEEAAAAIRTAITEVADDGEAYVDAVRRIAAERDAAIALSSTADVAGRWVSMADFERSGAKALVAMAERDAAIARAEKAEADMAILSNDENSVVNVLTRCKALVERIERQRDELGIQYEAQRARLALATSTIDVFWHAAMASESDDDAHNAAIDARAKWDALPGDALAQPDVGPALDRAHEASGVVVKP